jgi:hypothetical protein
MFLGCLLTTPYIRQLTLTNGVHSMFFRKCLGVRTEDGVHDTNSEEETPPAASADSWVPHCTLRGAFSPTDTFQINSLTHSVVHSCSNQFPGIADYSKYCFLPCTSRGQANAHVHVCGYVSPFLACYLQCMTSIALYLRSPS